MKIWTKTLYTNINIEASLLKLISKMADFPLYR